jgi:hypothetical protein
MDKIMKCKDCGGETPCSSDSTGVICSNCVIKRIETINTKNQKPTQSSPEYDA